MSSYETQGVVRAQPPRCVACGQPLGTGTLLDFLPDIPPAAAKVGMTESLWREFAARYRCPMCAESES
jgi:predicted RNA-binding Zn-ribbon protein involved in translation (DUF1610 family)